MDIARGCALLHEDVSTVLELSWGLGYRDGPLWVSEPFTPLEKDALDDFDSSDLLLVVDNNIKVLDAGTDAEIVRSAADELATEIMDRLNRPWPAAPGRSGVLEIGLIDDEIFWLHDGEKVCRLGELGTLALAG